MIVIDGMIGEGGGQILRSALALSLVTGSELRVDRIRGGRRRPGLRHQHLTAVHAAAAVGRAEIDGAVLGSQQLTFRPTGVHAGRHSFAVPTAGSAVLVLQTVLPALLTAAAPSQLTLEGGTHNPLSPPFEFLDRSFLPLVCRMGPRIETHLERRGFYPAGGGRFQVSVEPVQHLRPLNLTERGPVLGTRVRVLSARLPNHVAEREVRAIARATSWPESSFEVVEVAESAGPGNVVMIEIGSHAVTEVVAAFGARGLPAERVAAQALEEALRHLEAQVPVGQHLADQLLVPMAIAGSGSFVTLEPTLHCTTNIAVIRRFLDVPVAVRQLDSRRWQIDVGSG